jgi:phospholipase/carboxylesterase
MPDDNDKDGFLYIPPTYAATKPTPLIVLLHGAGRRSTDWSSGPLSSLFDNPAMIVVGPDSRGPTWDLTLGGFGPDVKFIDAALSMVFRKCNVDPNLVGLGGFSDGGSYALSLGVGNGDLFSALMAFSPGYYAPAQKQGKPRIFVQHGTRDTVLPIDAASRTIVPILKNEGYSVRYDEFDGIHTVTTEEVTKAVRWFVPGPN